MTFVSNKIKQFHTINRTNWFFYAFLLGMLCYFLSLSYSQVAFGNYLFLDGDNIEIYAPTTQQLARSIINHDNPFFSWSTSMGLNTSALVASDGQPLNILFILSLLFPSNDPSIIIFISMVLRAGLACTTFQIYSVKYLNRNKFICLLISLGYCMCAFQMSILTCNQIWMDALWLLPLIIYFLHSFLLSHNITSLVICYAYLFITNYYMGYMIGIFTFLYFSLLLFFNTKLSRKEKLHKLIIYFAGVLLSVGLSLFLLLPAAYFLLTHPVNDATTQFSKNINVIDVINQLFIGTNNSPHSFFPYIYTGIICTVSVPLFFVDNKISKKARFFYGTLLLFMILSCLLLPLYLFWHAFDAPDSWGHRFAYLISFITCSISCYELRYIKYIKRKWIIIFLIIYPIIYIYEIYAQKKYLQIYQTNSWLYFSINLFALIIITLLLLSYQRYTTDPQKLRNISAILLLSISAELVFNGYSAFYNNELSVPSTLSANYYQWIENTSDSLNEIKNQEGTDFYRVDSTGDYTYNSDMFFGYNGDSDFCSIENYRLRSTLRNLGIYTSPRMTLPFGYSEFTCMLLAIKYRINHFSYNSISYYMSENSNIVEPTNAYIGLGFLVDNLAKDYTTTSYSSAFENINQLASAIYGQTILLYDLSPTAMITFNENGINISEDASGKFIYSSEENTENEHRISLIIPTNDKPAYVQFLSPNHPLYDLTSPLLIGGLENIRYNHGRLSASYIKPFQNINNTNIITIEMTDDTLHNVYMPNVYAAYYDREAFRKLYDKLALNRLEVINYHNGYVHGKITVPENNSLLFTSIPNDEGWEVYVNGRKTDIVPLIDNTFIGVSLDAGDNDIEFIYHTPLAKEGFIISCISLLILLVLIYRNIQKKRNPNNKL